MRGFTWLEMLIATAVLGVLMAIAVPMYADYRERARIAKAVSEIGDLQSRIIDYQRENRQLPPDLATVGAGGLLDPWGNSYVYLDYAQKGVKPRKDKWLKPLNTDFDLFSVGKDGDFKENMNAKESADDVVRAWDGRFIGLGKDFDP